MTIDRNCEPATTVLQSGRAPCLLRPVAGATIRPATDADSEAIIRVIAACYGEYEGCVLLVDEEAPELRQPATCYEALEGHVWVAEIEGKVVGVVAVAPADAPGMFRMHRLYVAREERGRGQVRVLLDSFGGLAPFEAVLARPFRVSYS